MRAEILGTVISVVERPYTKKDGTPGIAHSVVFSTGGQAIMDEFYRTGDEWEKMGCKYGAVGTMVVDIRNADKTTKDGRPFQTREWRFVDFKLANANQPQPQPQPQPAVAPATPLPETPAPQEAQVQGTDLPY